MKYHLPHCPSPRPPTPPPRPRGGVGSPGGIWIAPAYTTRSFCCKKPVSTGSNRHKKGGASGPTPEHHIEERPEEGTVAMANRPAPGARVRDWPEEGTVAMANRPAPTRRIEERSQEGTVAMANPPARIRDWSQEGTALMSRLARSCEICDFSCPSENCEKSQG